MSLIVYCRGATPPTVLPRRKGPLYDEVTMKFLQPIGAILRGWTDSVAAAVIAAFDRVSSPRVIRLIEQDNGGFAVESAGKSENMPQRIAFADGSLSAPNLAPMFKGSRVEIVAAAETFPVSSAGTAGAGGGFPRRHRARADRPPDAMERQRGGVRLQHPDRERTREHHHGDRGHHAQGGDDLRSGGVDISSRRGRGLHRRRRAQCGPGQGVRAESPRPSRCRQAEPRAAGRSRRHGGVRAAVGDRRGLYRRSVSARRKTNWRGRYRSAAPPSAPAAMAATARRSRRWSGASMKRRRASSCSMR